MDEDHFSNSTSITNKTDELDYFCTEMLLGPSISCIITVLCVCVGLPASVWLLWVLIKRQHSGLINDVYMLNLTIMDLITITFKIPSVLNYFIWRDKSLLYLNLLLEGLSMHGRPLLMASICVDCYMAVVFPIAYREVKQTWYRHVVCAFVWVLMVPYQLMMMISSQLFHLPLWLISDVLAVGIIAFCDLSVLHALRKPDPSGKTGVHAQKQRALQAITNSFIMSLVAYLPPVVVFGFSPLLNLSLQELVCFVSMPTLTCFTVGTTIMPLLFLGNLGSLRHIRTSGCCRKCVDLETP